MFNDPAETQGYLRLFRSKLLSDEKKLPFLPAIIAIIVWLVALVAALGFLVAYAQNPGQDGSLPLRSEASSETAASWQLVMAVHPHCPCTQASVAELERLLASTPNRPGCRFLAYAPIEADDQWCESGLIQRLRKIDPQAIEVDFGGQRAAELGIGVSGGVLLRDRDGHSRFLGGITQSRGHEGDSAGKAAILMLLAGQEPAIQSTPIYGCRL